MSELSCCHREASRYGTCSDDVLRSAGGHAALSPQSTALHLTIISQPSTRPHPVCRGPLCFAPSSLVGRRYPANSQAPASFVRQVLSATLPIQLCSASLRLSALRSTPLSVAHAGAAPSQLHKKGRAGHLPLSLVLVFTCAPLRASSPEGRAR